MVSLTDHDKVTLTHHPSAITVPGVEVVAREEGVRSEYHIVILGSREPPPKSVRGSAFELLEWCRSNDLYAFVAHPYWSMLSGSDLLRVGNSCGVEAYNHGCEVEISRGYSGAHWDYALSSGLLLHGLAVDDAHAYSVDCLGGWVFLDLEELSVDGVLSALKEGRFYASSGIVVEAFELEADRARISCSGARIVKLLSGDTKGAHISVNLVDKLAGSWGLPFEVERWDRGFRIESKELRVSGRLVDGRIVKLEASGQLPARGFYRVELRDGEQAAWLNPVKL